MSAGERLLTAREIAEMISVSTETVLRWTRRGELPGIRLPGGAIRFREDALDRWLASRATRADTGPDKAADRDGLKRHGRPNHREVPKEVPNG